MDAAVIRQSARISHSASTTERANIQFRTKPGPTILMGGVETHPTNIMRSIEGEGSYQHTSGSASWGAMSLPLEDIVVVGAAIAGCDLTPPKDLLTVTPAPHAMAKLQRLHAAAGRWRKRPRKLSPIRMPHEAWSRR
jgi:hypothetical protein